MTLASAAETGAWAFSLVVLGMAFASIYVGYLAYQARVAREQASTSVRGPDPIVELSRVNEQVQRELAAASATLERARDAVQRGVRG